MDIMKIDTLADVTHKKGIKGIIPPKNGEPPFIIETIIVAKLSAFSWSVLGFFFFFLSLILVFWFTFWLILIILEGLIVMHRKNILQINRERIIALRIFIIFTHILL